VLLPITLHYNLIRLKYLVITKIKILFIQFSVVLIYILNVGKIVFSVLGFGGRGGGGNNRGTGPQQQRGGPNKFRGK